eukprot:CAMPEP_0195532612 /NCGR_PEP_ID=MMETSP0794_2-20130614/38599_1 /TAXON_ID=515487 /ORGANISM="Stephanopyxis turris, Strain CCMP 815" /LENGTH=119 /DNA_ID=CAMNT_0040664889 /DNA_START=250 /DNA_END=606 /DNA_ORIENTATION=+
MSVVSTNKKTEIEEKKEIHAKQEKTLHVATTYLSLEQGKGSSNVRDSTPSPKLAKTNKSQSTKRESQRELTDGEGTFELSSTMDGGNSYYGAMFDIVTHSKPIIIETLDLHTKTKKIIG